MKIEIVKGHSGPIRASDMQIGQVGVCKEIFNHLLLRSYNHVVDLNEPGRTWDGSCSLYVQVLHSGTELKITL